MQLCKIPNKMLQDLFVFLLASNILYVYFADLSFNAVETQHTQV